MPQRQDGCFGGIAAEIGCEKHATGMFLYRTDAAPVFFNIGVSERVPPRIFYPIKVMAWCRFWISTLGWLAAYSPSSDHGIMSSVVSVTCST